MTSQARYMSQRLAQCLISALTALSLSAMPLAAEDLGGAQLDLDTGGHRAVIRALVASQDGTRLWSAGDDKVVREWSLTTRQPGQILRGQIGPGNEGTIYALALSSDASKLAVAGYFAPHLSLDQPYGDVRIFDLASGQIFGVLKGYRSVVSSLAYEPVGDVLAVGGQGGVIQSWRAPFSDDPQRLADLDTQASQIMALTFYGGGSRLAAATSDYGLHLFDSHSTEPLDIEAADSLWETSVLALAPSPDGGQLAVAAEDGTIQIRDTEGRLLPAPPPVPFRPDALVWSENHLTIACGYRCENRFGTLTYQGGDAWQEIARTSSLTGIRAATLIPRRGELALSGGVIPSISVTDSRGAESFRLAGTGKPITAVGISADGSRIGFGHQDPCPELPLCPERAGALEFSMQLPIGDLAATPPLPLTAQPEGLLRAVLNDETYALALGRDPSSGFDGSALTIRTLSAELLLTRSDIDGAYISAMGLLPQRGEVILGGGNGVLLAQSLSDGSVTGEFIGHSADVLALAAAPEAARLVSGGADQTLRIWNLDSRKLVASLFAAGPDWILWTPEGYYHSSPEGDRLIGWHLNQGPDKAARFITARQLRQHLHSPEIVRRALLTADASAAAIELRGSDTELTSLLTRPAPEFELTIREDLPAPEGSAIIEIAGASLEEMEEWGFAILVNDRRVPAERITAPPGAERAPQDTADSDVTPPMAAPEPPRLSAGGNRRRPSAGSRPAQPDQAAPASEAQQPPIISLAGQAERLAAKFYYQIPVSDGENHVLVSSENDFGYVTERSGQALFRASKTVETPGRLFVAVVGVNRYPKLADCGGRSCDLAFPVADAIGFLRTVKAHSAPLFASMETLVIATPEDIAAAGASDVIDAGAVLAPEGKVITEALIDFLAKPGPEDTTIIFVASHGVNIDEDFYIVPADAEKRGDEFRKSSLVDWSVIQEEIGFATGRRILMLDTCHAANAFNAKLEKDAADARVIVFSATAANNTAQERRALGHGIFTYSVMQGLAGGASDGSGVRLLALADFIYREVVRLSDGRQEPFYHISQTSNFLLSKG